jgi:hypothetical protein
MPTYDDDDDDVPLSIVLAKSTRPSTATNGSKAREPQPKKDIKKSSGQADTVDNDAKAKSVGKSTKTKENKKSQNDAKNTNVSSEWAEVNVSNASTSRKQKSWAEWSRANTPLLVFLGLVVVIVACR